MESLAYTLLHLCLHDVPWYLTSGPDKKASQSKYLQPINALCHLHIFGRLMHDFDSCRGPIYLLYNPCRLEGGILPSQWRQPKRNLAAEHCFCLLLDSYLTCH